MSKVVEVSGFDIKHLIARGGMAAVYKAQQTSLGREVALKIMDNKQNDPSFADRFLNEGRMIASLHHPNVITIHDLGLMDDGRAFISMEYVEGGDLETKLRHGVSEQEALRILREVAECLVYVHEHDMVHRDIKPANILFRNDGSLVVTDFGIAKQLDTDVKLTRDGIAVGSPGYMSPEQAQAIEVDHRADIYALGVIFIEMLLGKNPYEAESQLQTSMNHVQMKTPVLEGEFQKYQGMVNKMLAKDPNHRFNDAQTLIRYLEDLLNDPDFGMAADEEEFEKHRPKKGLFSIIARNDFVIFSFFIALFAVGGYYFFEYVQFQTKVNGLLTQADEAYQRDYLMTPEDKSAYHFYNQVLVVDPLNQDAKVGIQQIAERYADLAESALINKKTSEMRKYIERGLEVDPENERLLKLKAR